MAKENITPTTTPGSEKATAPDKPLQPDNKSKQPEKPADKAAVTAPKAETALQDKGKEQQKPPAPSAASDKNIPADSKGTVPDKPLPGADKVAPPEKPDGKFVPLFKTAEAPTPAPAAKTDRHISSIKFPSGKKIEMVEGDKSAAEKPPVGKTVKDDKAGKSVAPVLSDKEAALKKEQETLLSALDKKADDIAKNKAAEKSDKSAQKTAAPKQEKAAAPAKKSAVKEDSPAVPPAPEKNTAPREAPRSGAPEQIVYLKISELHAFKNHPFGVRDDSEMKALVESVSNGGVNQPALVRPREDGGYEIVAGHRRQKASELAGYFEMPCIVREMTDDEAILAMTDDNLRQRSEILPSEKAVSLKMQVEAIKHQGARESSGQNVQKNTGQRSIDIVGERNNMNPKQVQRYIRLTELVPDIREAVDEKRLGFTSAVEISFINPKNQNLIAVSLDGQQSSPSLSQAQRLRELDVKGQLNGDIIDGILGEQKKEVDKVIISTQELGQYFGKDKTPREMKEQIITLLEDWAGKQKELAPPEKKNTLEK